MITMITPVWVKGRVELPESAKNARWLGMVAEPADAESGAEQWIRLSRETGMFETSRLVPGAYEAKLYGDLEVQYKPLRFDVPPGGVSNLVLVPEPEAPKKTQQGG